MPRFSEISAAVAERIRGAPLIRRALRRRHSTTFTTTVDNGYAPAMYTTTSSLNCRHFNHNGPGPAQCQRHRQALASPPTLEGGDGALLPHHPVSQPLLF